ncbi:hypothetical protein CCMA1212_006059 [Trichoderma ghanense]|uniref:Transposase n=1 Tax=Trichoderma ghanense TaxID=65468 RepID=A0ABY2H155_9HYPO
MPRIERKPHWSPHKRTRIRMMYEQGYTRKEIALKERVPPGSIYGIATRYTQQISARSQTRPGRPPKLTEYDKRHIRRLIRENPFITNQRLLSMVPTRVCVNTLTSYLKSEGIQHKSVLRRPKLTPEAAAKRLRFAQEHAQKPISYWLQVFFSDEVTIEKNNAGRPGWVFCCRVSLVAITSTCDCSTTNALKGERLDRDKVQAIAKRSTIALMFWGAFGAFKRTTLCALQGDPDSARHGITGRVILETLQSELPTILEPGCVFMQDNAPVHRSHLVQRWLRNWARENGIRIMDWPPYSPDLNPIENIWKLVKQKIVERYPELQEMPQTAAAFDLLEKAAVEAWEEIRDEVLENLVRTMPHRIEAVIRARGWYTKY